MTKRLQPIRLDAYKPLREVVSETLRQAIQDGWGAPHGNSPCRRVRRKSYPHS